jgi:indolepyruvate ferredoxin oxidoreductase
MRRVADQFEGDIRLHFHLAPPLLARRNERGELIKRRYGSWMMHAFKLLSRLKGLRGSAFDPFGYTQERRTERRLIADYERRLSELIAQLDAPRLPLAVELARVPESIRGFGHVKDKSLEDAQRRIRELLERFSEGEGQAQSTMPARPISRTAASQTAAH